MAKRETLKPNVIVGRNIEIENGKEKLVGDQYHWWLPIGFRFVDDEPKQVKIGDIVRVTPKTKNKYVLVEDIIETTQEQRQEMKIYQKVMKKISV